MCIHPRVTRTKRRQIPVSSLTKYPHLFYDTYWGAAGVEMNREIVTPAIIENRNQFAERWSLVEMIDTPWALDATYGNKRQGYYWLQHLVGRAEFNKELGWDHDEAFRDSTGGIVLACSNYDDAGVPPAGLGMREIPSIYNIHSRSWAARYENGNVLRAVARRTVYELMKGFCRDDNEMPLF